MHMRVLTASRHHTHVPAASAFLAHTLSCGIADFFCCLYSPCQRHGRAPMSSSSCTCALRRTRLMVRTPRCCASTISCRPSVDPAAVCSRYSPLGTCCTSKKPYAVTCAGKHGGSGLGFRGCLIHHSNPNLGARRKGLKVPNGNMSATLWSDLSYQSMPARDVTHR